MNIWSKKMVINSEDYVLTPIYLYLKNMLNVIGYQPIPFQFRPAIYYIFSNTFLQMVGALEKKLEMISWYISQNDYDYRYNYIHGNSQISANLQHFMDDEYKYCGLLNKDDLENVIESIKRSGVLSEDELRHYFD